MKFSYKWPAGNDNYTQQQAIDVGDVVCHQLRVYEIHRNCGLTIRLYSKACG